MHASQKFFLLMLVAGAWIAVLAGAALWQETPQATVRGVVVAAEDGRPVPKAEVSAHGIERSWWREVRADAQGRFELKDVPAGLAAFIARGNVHQMTRELRFVVREGPANRLTLRAAAVAPFLRVRAAAKRYQFTPDEPVALEISGYSTAARLTVQARRLSLAQLLGSRDRSSWAGDYRVPRGLGDLAAEKVIDPAPRDEERAVRAGVQFGHLPPGLYSVWAAIASAPRMQPDAADGVVISVTRLGMVTKFDGKRALAYVQDLVDRRPVAGALVDLYYGGRATASGRTGADGIYATALPGSDGGECRMVASLGDSYALTTDYAGGSPGGGDFRTYFYTDRPVYRPGQVVHFKGIVRERLPDGRYRVPAREPVRLEVRDAGDATILQRTLTTTGFGSFNGELALDREAATGVYQVTITARGQEDTGYFSVAEYRKPEFEVTVKPAKPRFLRGEPASFLVTARYYWGEPVRNTRLSYSLTYTPEWHYPGDDESRFLEQFYPAEGDEEGGGYGEEVLSGQGMTDAEGRLTVRFTPELPASDTQDYRYTLEASVDDLSRFPVIAKGSALVTRGLFRLEVDPDRWVLAPGETARVRLRAVDYDGRPQANVPITLAANRRAVASVTTGADGRANAVLPGGARGDLALEATAPDAAGNTVSERTTVWVTDDSFSAEDYSYAGLEIVPDRTTYRPGDVARVLVNVAQPGGYALVTVEGDRLFEHRVVRLAAKSTLVKVGLNQAYVPNVYLSVVTVQGRQFDHQEKLLRVSPAEHALNVAVTPDKARLSPRGSVTYTIRTTDARGRPVDAEASLGVVDESIYAIRPDRALEGMQYFYRYQNNQVQTTYSFPEIYLAGEPKDQVTEIREDFPDTARWFPVVRTGPTGVARVTVRLPDSLTTWRATVRAHTLATQVGAAISKVVVSKELFVRLETPRFFTQNDRSLVSSIVHNDTPAAQRVQVTLQAEGARLLGPATRAVQVAPSGSARVDWPLAIETAGQARFTTTAVASGGARDGVRKTVPVAPHGAESRAGLSGEVVGDGATFNLDLPKGAIRSATGAQVTISATPAAVLLQALDYMQAHDYGTTENAVGWFLPDMTVAMTFKELGFHYPPLEQRVGPAVRRSLARLYRLQTPSDYEEKHGGGWAWAAGAEEDPFWTAYALYGLVQAKAAGYAVDEEVLKRGTKALVRLLPREKDPSNRALICYVLVKAGRSPRREMDALEKRLPELQQGSKHYAVALLTLAFAESDLPRARRAAAWLEKGVKIEGDTAHWPEIYPWGFYSCNDNETTGYALMALLRTDPENPLVEKAVRWLLQKREGGGWSSTEDTASIIYALGAYLKRQRQVAPPDYLATVFVNGSKVGQARMSRETMFASPVIPIPAEWLREGPNEVRVERQGTGRLLYGASLTTFVQAEDLRAETSGLQVNREYFRRLRLRDIHGRTFERLVTAREPFRSGEELVVRVTVEVRDPARRGECREVIVRDPLPAGCEAIDEPDEEDYYYEVEPEPGGDWWEAAERRREVRDDEVRFYASFLRRGKNIFHYRMRAALPGDYHVLPARAAAAYIPEISGRSGEVRVKVGE